MEGCVQTIHGTSPITVRHGGDTSDIVDRGIVLAGGGALLKNLDTLLREETGLPIIVAESPLTAVVLGSGKALDELDLLRDVAFD